jgi:hypothetical protein
VSPQAVPFLNEQIDETDVSNSCLNGSLVINENGHASENMSSTPNNINPDTQSQCVYFDWILVVLCERQKNSVLNFLPQLRYVESSVHSVLGFMHFLPYRYIQ